MIGSRGNDRRIAAVWFRAGAGNPYSTLDFINEYVYIAKGRLAIGLIHVPQR